MQNKFKVQLNTIDRVKQFVKICDSFDIDIDLSDGIYTINAKSIMAIFSLDLIRPLNIYIHSQDSEIIERFNKEMSDFKYEH